MTNNPEQIAARVREMRELLEMSQEEIADKLGISVDLYKKYENNEDSFPISSIYTIADIFGMDFTTLLTGDAPRMGGYTLTRAGEGVDVKRYPGYRFQSLAFNFIGRTMEPMMVELDPSENAALVSHGGQEFNYVVEGKIKVVVGKREFFLNTGDLFYFDPSVPHGQYAVDGPAKFITVIQK